MKKAAIAEDFVQGDCIIICCAFTKERVKKPPQQKEGLSEFMVQFMVQDDHPINLAQTWCSVWQSCIR